MVQLSLGSNCRSLSRPVYVLQNCVCKTRPPGVGVQQVFRIAVVFSHENSFTAFAPRHWVRLGKVLSTEKPCEDHAKLVKTTARARTVDMELLAGQKRLVSTGWPLKIPPIF
jgi:hypothetical protein